MAPEKGVGAKIIFVVDPNRLQIRTGKDETTRRLFADEPHPLAPEVVDAIDVVPRSQRNDHSPIAVDPFGVCVGSQLSSVRRSFTPGLSRWAEMEGAGEMVPKYTRPSAK